MSLYPASLPFLQERLRPFSISETVRELTAPAASLEDEIDDLEVRAPSKSPFHQSTNVRLVFGSDMQS